MTRSPREPERPWWHAALTLAGVPVLLLATLWALARGSGWSVDRVLWIGLGAFLTLMTIGRPWWFWEQHKARWLRDLVGDEVTAFFYLVVAGTMIWVGLFTG